MHSRPVLWHLDTGESTPITLDHGEVIVGDRLTLKDRTDLLRHDFVTGQIAPLDTGPHPVTAFASGHLGTTPVVALARADATVTVRDLCDGTVLSGPLLLPNAATATSSSGGRARHEPHRSRAYREL